MPKEDIFFSGDAYFNALFEDIDQAEKCIDIETYIFAADALGERLSQHLIAAAKRGVHVRLLVDGAGTGWQKIPFFDNLRAGGVEVRVYHPFLWRFWQLRYGIIRIHFLLKAFYFFYNANKRNHRKVCVIDQKIGYVGSANISICHLSASQEGKGWRDTIVRLEDIDLRELTTAFNACWSHETVKKRARKINLHNPIRLNNTRRKRRLLYKQLLQHMARCQKRIWIVNSYFVPDNFLLHILKDRARMGVDVRILLPEKADLLIMPWASSAFYASLLEAGVKILEYTPSMLHAKSLQLDDWVMVGSSNLNHRSLLHDLEVDVNIQQKETKLKIEEQFLKDVALSKEISLDSWLKRGWIKKNIGRLFLYLKYWI
ncbi:MAG: cardiolipin synthetase [Gammaproteobacteria bacterium]|nr:cardiolipin synthetase [Gammaproteobacteria bacterium]